jgi:hypothetical protein
MADSFHCYSSAALKLWRLGAAAEDEATVLSMNCSGTESESESDAEGSETSSSASEPAPVVSTEMATAMCDPRQALSRQTQQAQDNICSRGGC